LHLVGGLAMRESWFVLEAMALTKPTRARPRLHLVPAASLILAALALLGLSIGGRSFALPFSSGVVVAQRRLATNDRGDGSSLVQSDGLLRGGSSESQGSFWRNADADAGGSAAPRGWSFASAAALVTSAAFLGASAAAATATRVQTKRPAVRSHSVALHAAVETATTTATTTATAATAATRQTQPQSLQQNQQLTDVSESTSGSSSSGSSRSRSSSSSSRSSSSSSSSSSKNTLRENPVANPAVRWPPGKPWLTTEYPEEFDLSDPKGSLEQVGQRILDEIREELPEMYELPNKEVDWVNRSLQYNTLGGKMYRGLVVVATGVELMKSKGKTPTNRDLNRFAVLGWAVEMLQAAFVMADDMMDGSVTRRGLPCWYRQPDVGLLATNDFLMIEMLVYKVLKRHFGEDPYFVWLVDLFLETSFQTECGQLLDSLCANCELEELTPERWTLLVKYKTAYYSFYLPVALAMIVTGERDPKSFNIAREILVLMGVYFQAQDDYLDAFANADKLGKIGTDIQDKKCSWLFSHAFHDMGTPKTKEYLEQHYGQCKVGSEEENQIKEIYKELGLKDLFKQYESEIQEKLATYQSKAEAVGLPWSIFERFFGLIHKRTK